MTLFSRLIFAGSLVVTLILAAGCASMDDATFNDPGTSQPPTQVARLQIGDMVTVTLTELPETIEPHTETIKEDGTITMPYIGHVQAVGKTAGELQNIILDAYVPKYYIHLNVSVSTGDRVYYVRGEVKAPGRQLYLGEITVTKAIGSAGDFTDFANHKNVWLIRGHKRLKVNCDDIFQHPEKDPLVYPGDQIEVRRRIF